MDDTVLTLSLYTNILNYDVTETRPDPPTIYLSLLFTLSSHSEVIKVGMAFKGRETKRTSFSQ